MGGGGDLGQRQEGKKWHQTPYLLDTREKDLELRDGKSGEKVASSAQSLDSQAEAGELQLA